MEEAQRLRVIPCYTGVHGQPGLQETQSQKTEKKEGVIEERKKRIEQEGEHETYTEKLPHSKIPSLVYEAFCRFPVGCYAWLLPLHGCTVIARQSGCSSQESGLVLP